MAVHRYWRVQGIVLPAVDLFAPADIALCNGYVPMNQGIVPTASSAPAGGTLAQASDGRLDTFASWTKAVAEGAGFWIMWDLGQAAEVNTLRLGAFNANRYPTGITLAWSDNASDWTALGNLTGLTYPGDQTWSAFIPVETGYSLPALQTRRVQAAQRFANSEVGSIALGKVQTPRSARDMVFGGRGQISGTVKVDSTPDVPVHRRVRLFRDRDGVMVQETWSDKVTGAYEFNDIEEGATYSVVSYDYLHDFRAVIADNLTPEVA